MTESVEADAGQAGARGSRDEHATAQTALIGRGTGAARKHERVVFGVARSVVAALRPGRDEPRAVPGLWRDERALDDCAAHPQVRRRAVEHQVAPAQTDRFGDPQPGGGEQLEQRAPLRWDFVEQPRELRAREVAPLARRPRAPGTAARQHDLLGRVGVQQSFGDRRAERQT